MPITLNAAAQAALETGDYWIETTVQVLDENGVAIDLPIGTLSDTDAQVLDVTIEEAVRETMTGHLSMSVKADKALAGLLLKYRRIWVRESIVERSTGKIVQEVRAFTGKIQENAGLEAIAEDGTENQEVTVEAFGVLKDAEGTAVSRRFDPTLAPVKNSPTDFPNYNLVPILKRVKIPLPAKSSYTVGDVQPLPLVATYDNRSNLSQFVEYPNGVYSASSNTAIAPDAMNGKQGHLWASTGEANAWIEVDFGADFLVDGLAFANYGGGYTPITSATIIFSSGDPVVFSGLPSSGVTYLSFPERVTRKVRIQASNAAGVQIALYEATPLYKGNVVNPIRTALNFYPAYPNVNFATAASSSPAGPTNWVISIGSIDENQGFYAGDFISIGNTGNALKFVSYGSGTVTLEVPAGKPAGAYSVAVGTRLMTALPYASDAANTAGGQRLVYRALSAKPSRTWFVEAVVIERWVVKVNDTYAADPFKVTTRLLNADEVAEDLASLPTSDARYLDYYRRWDPRGLFGMEWNIGGALTLHGDFLEYRPEFGYVRWTGRPYNFRAGYGFAGYVSPIDPAAAGSQAEILIAAILTEDLGIPAGDVELEATAVGISPVVYKDKAAATIFSEMKETGAMPPTYFLQDTPEGKVTGRHYFQKPVADVVLRTVEGISERSQEAIFTAVKTKVVDPIAKNLAAVSLAWVDASLQKIDQWFDGAEVAPGSFDNFDPGGPYAAAFLINNPIDKFRIAYTGRLLVGLEPDPTQIVRAYDPNYFAPYHHPGLSYTNFRTLSAKEETVWLPFEPPTPYLLWIAVYPTDSNAMVGSPDTPAGPDIGEIQIWTTVSTEISAFLIDNSAAFPLPSDALAPKNPATGATLYATFADRGTDRFGSPENYWYSPSRKAYYRYAPAQFMARNAMSYDAGLHRINPVDFGAISPVQAGYYARQTLNEIIRRSAPVDVRAVWEPVRSGDTVQLPDGRLVTVMGRVQSGLGQDRALSLSCLDLSF